MLKICALIFKFLVSNLPANRHRGQVDTFVSGLTVIVLNKDTNLEKEIEQPSKRYVHNLRSTQWTKSREHT
jgi:hypothetical protein